MRSDGPQNLSDFLAVDHRRRNALTGLRPVEAKMVLLSGGLLGLTAFVCMVAIVVILSEDLWSDYSRVAVGFLSALGWWSAMRFPTKPVILPNPRPVLRSLRGSHFPSYLLKSDWEGIDRTGLTLRGCADFAVRAKPLHWQLSAYILGAVVSYLGTLSDSGEVGEIALICYTGFGALVGGAARSTAKLLLRKRAITIDAHRITLRYATSYLPNVTLQQNDLLGGIVRNGELMLVSRPERVDVIDLHRFEDARGLVTALGLNPSDEDLTGDYEEVSANS